jgi:hypothetical protein
MKYILTRTDDQPIPETARFFILRLDEHGKPETRVARAAVANYAAEVNEIDPDAARAATRALLGLP